MSSTFASDTGRAPARRNIALTVAPPVILFGAVGLALAALTGGVARPWLGVGLVVAMALALVVGASKTSSA